MMKLWLLKKRGDTPKNMIWDYDVNLGFVIRAETERVARYLADELEGDEGRIGDRLADSNHVWLNPEITTCDELTAEANDTRCVVLQSYRRSGL